MKNITIRTAGNNGKGILRLLRDNPCYQDIQVVALIDQDVNKIGTMVSGIPVISVFTASQWYQDHRFEKVVIPCEFHSIAFSDRHMIDGFHKELCDSGIQDCDILISNLLWIQSKTADCTGFEQDFVPYSQFFHIRYLEFSAAFHCNLNCKGCSHFSPLVQEEFPVFDEVERDFLRLKELVPHIHRIRILGGEPLLNPEIQQYVQMVRRIYPYTELHVVTNGILLKSLSDAVYKCFRENNVTIDISVYRPLRDFCDEMISLLKAKGLPCSIYNCYEFVPTLKREEGNFPFGSTEKTCVYRNLAHGCISSCMLMHDMKYYNDYFGEELPHKDGLINLHDSDLTSAELIRRLKMKYSLCDYCESFKHMSPELGQVYHDEIQISWGSYTRADKPRKEDWYGKEEKE